ncbi:MAG: hypothetical protein ACTSUE_24605 [Promethearchaeota archaeon]
MARDIYKEAEEILGAFQEFWAVDDDINHLYGIVERTGVKEFTVELFFSSDFPATPPELRVSQNIVELLGRNIELQSLLNWNENSRTVEILRELKMLIERHLEDDFLDLKPKPAPKEIELKSYSDFATPEPFEFHETGKNLGTKPVARPKRELMAAAAEAAAAAREVEAPAVEDEPTIIPDNKKWSEDQLASQPAPANDMFDESFWAGTSAGAPAIDDGTKKKSLTGDPMRDARIAEEHDLLTREYSFDYIDNIANVKVYLTISIDSTFIIGINFIDFPNKPKITFPDKLLSIIPDPGSTLISLRDWTPQHPPNVVEIIRELEMKLWSYNDIELKIKKIFGEFEAVYLPNSMTGVRVTILTYGFKEFHVTIDLKHYPDKPIVEYGKDLANLLTVPPGDLKVMQNWEQSTEKEAVAILREINWLIDKRSRLDFELDLLQGSLKDVRYDPMAHVIIVKMKGTMKTEEQSFEFKATLPDNYPMNPPTIELISELAEEKMEEKIDKSLKGLLAKWIPQSSYLVDAFNAVSKAIFEVSVITCIICHQFECPSCGVKMDSPDLSEPTCKAQCVYCERSYHKHCWDQTIATFGKCGFCLRPPPPDQMP